MKILHVIDSAGIYGAEMMLLNLMEEHRKMSHSPSLLSIEDPASTSEVSLSRIAVERGLSAFGMCLGRGFRPGSGIRICRYAEERGVDIVHIHGYKGNILLGSMPRSSRKSPFVSTIHGWTATRKFTRIGFYMSLDRFFLRRMDAIVNVHAACPPLGRVERFVVENGIPELSFNHDVVRDDVIAKFCGNGFVVGAIARLSEEKGLLYLIDALSLVMRRGINLRAVIIGDGPQKRILEKSICDKNLAGKVLIAGYRESAHNYLPLFNAFVLPSMTEGLPITILEAMQAAVPIVATRVGGIPKALGNGKLGFLVDPGNPGAIADALEYCHSHPEACAEMCRRARDTALTEYSSSRMAEDYIRVYRAVLNRWKR